MPPPGPGAQSGKWPVWRRPSWDQKHPQWMRKLHYRKLLKTANSRPNHELEIELEAARQETLFLQKSVAWRDVGQIQASIIEKVLSGKNIEGHFVVMNATDLEQAQFFQRIAGLCIKIKVRCMLHPRSPQSPDPFLFAPTGVLSFAVEGADKTFIDAFMTAGLVTRKTGTLIGTQLFPEGIKSGIIIAAKPDALESLPFSTLSPRVPQ